MQHYTRESIERLLPLNRPSVRVKYDCDLVDEDGRCEESTRPITGRIDIEGNNPWVVIYVGGKQIAERFSWELVLQVINDRFTTPIHFTTRVRYEV